LTAPIRTALVGSYAQPDWLIDRAALKARLPARIPKDDLWQVPAQHLAQAKDDGVLSILWDQLDAGIDIVTDGEVRRESYSAPFANALDGIDGARPATKVGRAGKPNEVPRVVGPLSRPHPVHVDDVRFLRKHTDRTVKVTVPGPFTLSQLAVDEHYGSPKALGEAYADCLNREIRDLFESGAGIVQLDEPYLQAKIQQAEAYGVQVIQRALRGIEGTTALHVCFGYAAMVGDKSAAGYSCLPLVGQIGVDQVSIEAAQPRLDLSKALEPLEGKVVMLGVLDLGDETPETADVVERRLMAALEHLPPERIIAAPDCGMKYLPRDSARGKLAALVEGTGRVNARIGALAPRDVR
jgi:5-methyltetrahydropteroyltriglutamate--homocysteine methyltransferase